MTLPNDVSPCAGRFGLGPDDPICPRREQCARYQALLAWSHGRPIPVQIPVATGLCRDGDDHFIGADA